MPFLIRFSVFAAIALGLGLGSAWQFADQGFFATTQRLGPWVLWRKEGAAGADPYTLAHLARAGTVAVTAKTYLAFTATADSAGSSLSGDCTYIIRGRAFPALWWDIAAFTPAGAPIRSKSGRSSFNSGDIAMSADGQFAIRLSPDVQPGNWLPSQTGQRVVLKLNVLRPLNANSILHAGRGALPEIVRKDCS